MTSKVLTAIGLSLGFVGIWMLFHWGWPQPAFTSGKSITIGATEAVLAEVAAEKGKHKVIAGTGLVLVLLGQILQIVAIFVPERLQKKQAAQ